MIVNAEQKMSPDAIIQAARGWLDTRFLHQGRLKKTASHKGGVDCLGLLVGVASELCLADKQGQPLPSYDDTQYSRMPDTTKLQHVLGALLEPKPITEMKTGDVALFKLDGNPQHLAIIGENKQGRATMIHAYAQARKVVEHELDMFWKKSLVAAYTLRS